ncbi:MAG: TonB family protein [Acidobacteria bacterium]|nr:TonB family protein [Acidobacteriota bacterium]
MSKRLNLALLPLVLLLSHAAGSAATVHTPASFRLRAASAPLRAATNERQQDGLAGPVRRVRTETAKITVKNGKPVEGARQVLETTTYDQKGNRVDNAYFLAAGGSLTGKEVYKYDARGNIVEMTLHNDDGTLLAKEVYTYEFDSVGNWVKMTTSVAVMEGGTVSFEPSEVTYRMISYFLDESMLAKMQPASAQSPAPASAAPVAASAQPQPAASNAQANSAAAQPKPSPAAANAAANPAAQKQPAKEAAPRNAALLVASLDKGAAPAPAPGAASNQTAAGGPAVKAEGDAPAPAVPFRSGPLRPISGGILNGKAINLPMPNYPDAAKRARVSGVVEVEVVIDINGKVISAKALRGPGMLLQAAETSARLARFTPTLLSGQPMKVVGVITYNFTLQQ